MTKPYSARVIAAKSAFSVTTSDSSADNFAPTNAVYVGTAGNISVVMANNNTQVFTNVQAGCLLPISIIRVNSTNTSAANIVGLRALS